MLQLHLLKTWKVPKQRDYLWAHIKTSYEKKEGFKSNMKHENQK
jgi:hypothetical protein